MSFGNCQGCNQPLLSYDWCKSCNYDHFRNDFNNWTSKNEIIDELIQTIQLKSSTYQEIIEWIPEDRLIIQNYIGKGRFGTVYKAIWKDGYIGYWNYERNCWKRYGKDCTVAVKVLNNSKNIKSDLLSQIFSVQNFNIQGLIRYYGITQDSTTKNYAIISQYLESNVKTYLNKSNLSTNLLLLEKLEISMDISSTLFKIHNSGLLHENLHINNILRDMDNKIYLSDLGLTHPPNKSNPKNDIKVPGWSNSYNLLNFIPPEVINGNNYTKESDIYCFGIILWEIFSQREFFDSNQKRKPPVIINKPRLFKNNPKYPRLPYKLELLISKCWDHDPKCRPTIKTIYKQLSEWWMGSWNKNINDIITPFLNSDQIIVINVKEFDPIYIHNILRPDDDDDDDSVQSTSKHFKSILFEQPNQQNQEIIKPTKKLSLLLSQSPSSDNNIISNLLNNSTKPEETYQSSFTDKITHTNITNTNPDTKTNTNTNTPEETYETPFMDCITNIGIDDDSQLIDYDSLLNLYKDIELECAPNQSTSNNKKVELFIMPGTLPKTEPYYFKENILSNSDITFYNTYFKELIIKMHHYWIVNNLSSSILKIWKMTMRTFLFNILVYIYFLIFLFLLNRFMYFVVGYNLFYENKMKTVLGI